MIIIVPDSSVETRSGARAIRIAHHVATVSPTRRRSIHGQGQGAGRRAVPDRARLRQGLDHAARQEREGGRDRGHLDRLARASTSRSASAACRAGRVVEIYGPESSGKTTLALHVVAEAQKKGGVCAFIDAEHALDPVYARKLGVNVDDLLISQPDTGEQALEIADTLVRSGAIDVLVIDSVAALVPRAEIEGEMGDSAAGPAGAADEPGAAQADRLDLPLQHAWSSSSTRSA